MVALFFFFAQPVRALAPIQEFEPRAYLAEFSDNIVNDAKVIRCESNWKMVYGDSGSAYGRAQFWEETFYRMQKLSGDNPMYQYGDERAELRIFAWAMKHPQYAREWTCWRNL